MVEGSRAQWLATEACFCAAWRRAERGSIGFAFGVGRGDPIRVHQDLTARVLYRA